MTSTDRAAVGFTVKSGWASAVVVSGADRPQVIGVRTVHLSDPDVPDSRQPYHAGFGTARDAGPELARLVRSVERFGHKSVARLIQEIQDGGPRLGGAGIVVGSTIDPAQIANAHIRIHALEGQLFRRVVERAAADRQLRCHVWRERDLYASATALLKQPEPAVRRTLAAMGKATGGPWRAEQKAAALAAWLVLANT